jgi:hypothetical protein
MATRRKRFGAVAQLGERCNGIAEVRGSIPLGSTISKEPRSDAGFFVLGDQVHEGPRDYQIGYGRNDIKPVYRGVP